MEEAEVPMRQLVESEEDVPVVFDLTDEALHKMALSVKILIVLVWLCAVRARWNHRDGPVVDD